MTAEEIKQLKAGRELNALMLEVVFKFPRKKLFPPEYWEEGDEPFSSYWYIPSGKPKRTHMIDARAVPDFSGSITAAWHIVETLRANYDIQINPKEPLRGVRVSLAPLVRQGSNACASRFSANEETAPLAICKAALLALLQGSLPCRYWMNKER